MLSLAEGGSVLKREFGLIDVPSWPNSSILLPPHYSLPFPSTPSYSPHHLFNFGPPQGSTMLSTLVSPQGSTSTQEGPGLPAGAAVNTTRTSILLVGWQSYWAVKLSSTVNLNWKRNQYWWMFLCFWNPPSLSLFQWEAQRVWKCIPVVKVVKPSCNTVTLATGTFHPCPVLILIGDRTWASSVLSDVITYSQIWLALRCHHITVSCMVSLIAWESNHSRKNMVNIVTIPKDLMYMPFLTQKCAWEQICNSYLLWYTLLGHELNLFHRLID